MSAIFAIFPLYQWYAESESRELDRLSNLVLATEACQDTGAIAGLSVENSAGYTMRLADAFLDEDPGDRAEASLWIICSSISNRLVSDPTLLGLADSIAHIYKIDID